MFVAALVVVYALRDYAPVIANTYELRRIGDGSTFRTNRSFRPVKVETISSKVKREKGSVDLGSHIKPLVVHP